MVKSRRVRVTQALLVVVVTAGLIVATYVFLERSNEDPIAIHEAGAPSAAPSEPKDGAALREELLHASAAKAGLTPERGVWGVIMERGYAKGTATFVALVDGTASMYLSTGAAVVGGKVYTPARAAALKLCARAADARGATVPADKFPKPAQGRVRFYVLSEGGVRTAEVNAAPGRGDAAPEGALAALLAAGDELVAGLQEATSKGIVR